MRVPLLLSILLAIAVPIVVWWLGVRDMNFLAPPSEAKLVAVRQQTAAALPRAQIPAPPAVPQAQPAPSATAGAEKKPEPAVEIGDLNPNPGLNTYADLAPKGARHLIELASLLETAGELPRTLLAWERVLDSTTPEPAQATAAIAAIQRLRSSLPAVKTSPAKAIPVVIHASTGTKLESSLKTSLDQTAHSLELASCGILKVTAQITINRKSDAKSTSAKSTSAKNTNAKGASSKGSTSKGTTPTGPPPTVAIWLTGPAEKSPATETLSFTLGKPEALQTDLQRRLFRLTGNRLQQTLAFPPLTPAATDETPLHALEFHITRLHWEKFGRSLNTPPAAP